MMGGGTSLILDPQSELDLIFCSQAQGALANTQMLGIFFLCNKELGFAAELVLRDLFAEDVFL